MLTTSDSIYCPRQTSLELLQCEYRYILALFTWFHYRVRMRWWKWVIDKIDSFSVHEVCIQKVGLIVFTFNLYLTKWGLIGPMSYIFMRYIYAGLWPYQDFMNLFHYIITIINQNLLSDCNGLHIGIIWFLVGWSDRNPVK